VPPPHAVAIALAWFLSSVSADRLAAATAAARGCDDESATHASFSVATGVRRFAVPLSNSASPTRSDSLIAAGRFPAFNAVSTRLKSSTSTSSTRCFDVATGAGGGAETSQSLILRRWKSTQSRVAVSVPPPLPSPASRANSFCVSSPVKRGSLNTAASVSSPDCASSCAALPSSKTASLRSSSAAAATCEIGGVGRFALIDVPLPSAPSPATARILSGVPCHVAQRITSFSLSFPASLTCTSTVGGLVSACRSSRTSTSTEPDAVSGDDPTVRCCPETVPSARTRWPPPGSGDRERTTSSASAVPVTPASTSERSSPAAPSPSSLNESPASSSNGLALQRMTAWPPTGCSAAAAAAAVSVSALSDASAAVARLPSTACVNTVPPVPMIACSSPAKRNSNEPSAASALRPAPRSKSIGRFVAARSAMRCTVRSANRAPRTATRVAQPSACFCGAAETAPSGTSTSTFGMFFGSSRPWSSEIRSMCCASSSACATKSAVVAQKRRSTPAPSSRRTCSCTDG
jgi:hypothetical protein